MCGHAHHSTGGVGVTCRDTKLNELLRATSWVLKGNQFAPLYTNNTYSQLDIMNDTDQCEENDHVIEFSIIITMTEQGWLK